MDKKMVIYLLIIITSFVIIISSFLTIRNIAVQRNIEEGNSNSTTIGGLVTNISKNMEYDNYTGKWFGEKEKEISVLAFPQGKWNLIQRSLYP